MTIFLTILIAVLCMGFGFLLAKLINAGRKLDIVEVPSSEQGRKVIADILREKQNEITKMDTPAAVDLGNAILHSRRDRESDIRNEE